MSDLKINSFEELLSFIEGNELSQKQIGVLLDHSINVYYAGASSKVELLEKLQEYWEKYGAEAERPPYIDGLPQPPIARSVIIKGDEVTILGSLVKYITQQGYGGKIYSENKMKLQDWEEVQEKVELRHSLPAINFRVVTSKNEV